MADSSQEQPSVHEGIDLAGRVMDGRYHIERRIGEGGFSVTYRATHLGLNVPVALKVLKIPAHLDGEHKALFIQNFLAEGKLLFQLGSVHPAIARSLDAGIVDGDDGSVLPFIAMEWLDGVSLEAELQARRGSSRPTFSLSEALQCLREVALGLAVAHDEGIAHRDVKPGNILLLRRSGTTTAKILDFGVAKVLGQWPTLTGQMADTTGGPAAFTPAYASPEQWLRRLGATGPWTDVHAFALVLVEMMVGRRALDGNDGPQLMAACLDSVVRPTPRTLGCQVPSEVEAVFARALALDPRGRHANLKVFWSELCRASGWQPTTGAELGLLTVAYAPISARPADPTEQTGRPLSTTITSGALGWREKLRPTWVAAGILGAVVMVAGALLFTQRDDTLDRVEVAFPPKIDAAQATPAQDANPPFPDAALPVLRQRRPHTLSPRPASASSPREVTDDLSTHEEFRFRK